jgi:hypothetical protein
MSRSIPEWLDEAMISNNQLMDAVRAYDTLDAAIIGARAGGDNDKVMTLTNRLNGSLQTQVTRRRSRHRWIKKLSSAARTGWFPHLWNHSQLAFAKFKNNDALAAEGIVSSLRSVLTISPHSSLPFGYLLLSCYLRSELREYKELKEVTPSHISQYIQYHGRRNDRDICLKRYPLMNDEARQSFIRSCRIWSSLDHVGLLPLKAVWFDDTNNYGYTETYRCGGGTLRDWLGRIGNQIPHL